MRSDSPTEIEIVDEGDRAIASYSRSHVALLFSKSAIYIHPTPRAKDNISGYLSISARPSPTSRTREASELLLSWIPNSYLGDELDRYTLIERDGSADVRVKAPSASSSQYAFSVPLAEIGNLVVKQPRKGWNYGSVVVVTTLGTTFPALFFHDDECISTIAEQKKRAGNFDPFGDSGDMFWGFDSVLAVLQSLTSIKKSETSLGTYVLNPLLPPHIPSANNGGPSLQWKILEKFGRITRLGKSTADTILESKTGQEVLAKLPPQIRQMVGSEQAQTLAKEYDSARLYLARWAASISDSSQFAPPSSTEEIFEEETNLGMFEVLSLSEFSRREPVTEAEWASFFNEHGTLVKSPKEVKDALFHGSCVEGIMGEVWGFLLGVYPWTSDSEMRKAIAASKREEYYSLKKEWFNSLDCPSTEFEEERNRIEKDIHRTDRQHPYFEHEDMPSPDPTAEWGTNAHMEQLKDILLTYNVWNKDLGYVQGMSDLLAPVYVVSEDDSLAFWSFVGLMQRMQRNFLRDQSGMRTQLTQLTELTHFMLPKLYAHLEKCESLNFFFFFRMLLIIFKREFSFPTILNMWTVLFTDYYTQEFQIFCALAILDLHSAPITNHLGAFDEILKYINDLSGRMRLNEILARAEKLYISFRAKSRELSKRHDTLARRNQSRTNFETPGSKPQEMSPNLRQLLG